MYALFGILDGVVVGFLWRLGHTGLAVGIIEMSVLCIGCDILYELKKR
jgi:hypothetical protein